MNAQPPPIAPPAVPGPAATGAAVTAHLICVGCRYDLHGLDAGGNCPECGWEVGATIRASQLDPAWLAAMRTGLRWMLASMYMLAFFAATRYVESMEFLALAVMHLGAALTLLTPNPNRPDDTPLGRWPLILLLGACGAYLLGSSRWMMDPYVGWFVASIGAAVHAAALTTLWWRIQQVFAQGIAPASAVIARNLAALTIVVGVLAVLPPVLWEVLPSSLISGVSAGLRLLWLLALVVWFFASIITLHLAGISLRRLIQSRPARTAHDA
ncbi:MAG: hypothetical protein IT430_15540 [Phycisphaerales bacterium]|nr:hypothetical protein [Phycisphaerales bacterium]